MTRENKIGTYFDITEILDTIPFVFFKDIHGKYQGANLNQARSFGFYHPSDFIGKTIFEIIDDSQTAQRINHADNEVMQKDIKLITEETLETTEGKRIFLSQRQPVHDERGQVVGMMGFAMDITDIKNSQHQLEAQNEKLIQEKHGLEVEYYKNIADQQIQFHRIAKQIAHDIVSPLSAFNTIISRLENIPENHRSTLKMAATRIGDITNDLLNQFRPTEQEDARSTAEQEVIFASLALKNIMSEKRIENHTQTVQFDHDIEPQACFAFIRTNRKSFQRILSNVFNNALDAMQGMKGIILATMRITDDHVFIEIADEGKGLSVEVREKIMNGIAVTDLRHNGHGTDLGQVRDSLKQCGASLNIKPREPHGTRVILTFPRIAPPVWTTNRLKLCTDQIILILDDDSFIHGAWDASLEPILASHPKMKIVHFTEAQKLLNFCVESTESDRQKMLLLSDFELIGQNTNGIEVIKKLNFKNSLLVTSHFDEAEVQQAALALDIPVVPKLLATKMTVQIIPHETPVSPAHQNIKSVDIILLEDDPVFAAAFQFRFSKKKIKHYLDPRIFLAECQNYPKDAVISIDNNFGIAVPLSGIEVAAQLNKLGFTRLFLVSGSYFHQNQLPNYLTFIEKLNLDFFDSV